MQVQTRGGLFGPGGYGGGIFDGSSMGFGGLGSAGESRPVTLRGLGAADWEFRGKVSNPEIVALQKAINVELTRRGYQPLTVDGKLGPATCGATAWLGSKNTKPPVDFGANPDLGLIAREVSSAGVNLCTAFTYPTLVGQSRPHDNDPLVTRAALPWLGQDPRTAELQRALNNELAARDFLPIEQDGVLDGNTCGAMRTIDELSGQQYMNFGGTCQEFIAPKRRPAPVAPAPEPVDDGAVVASPRKGGVTAAWVVGGLAAAAAVAGLVAASKKKKRG